MDQPAMGTMASQIGPIPSDGGEFLKFLIVVREIAETINPIEERINKIRELLAVPKWMDFDLVWWVSYSACTNSLARFFSNSSHTSSYLPS